MHNKLMPVSVVVILSFFITVFATILIPFNAIGESGNDTIHEDYYVTHMFSFNSGKSVTISYTMSVTSGPYIDVYFLDSQNFKYYSDGVGFDYYIAMSDINTKYASNSITLSEHDTYYLVFDNTDTGTSPPWNGVDDVAYVDYTMSSVVTPNSPLEGENVESIFPLILVLIFAIVIIIFIVTLGLIVYKKGDENKPTLSNEVPNQSDVIPTSNQTLPQQPLYPPPPTSSFQNQQQPITESKSDQPQIKYCTSCGKQIPIDCRLCPYCGLQQVY